MIGLLIGLLLTRLGLVDGVPNGVLRSWVLLSLPTASTLVRWLLHTVLGVGPRPIVTSGPWCFAHPRLRSGCKAGFQVRSLNHGFYLNLLDLGYDTVPSLS